MFDHMVPAHIARKVGWNTGFDTFNPAVDLSAGPLLLTSVSDGTAPCWCATRRGGGARRCCLGDGVGRPDRCRLDRSVGHDHHGGVAARSVQPGLADRGARPGQRAEFDPPVAVLSVPGVQREVDGRSHVAARQAVAHAIDRTSLLNQVFGTMDPSLTFNKDHLAVAWQTSYSASTASGEYAQPDLSHDRFVAQDPRVRQDGGDALHRRGRQALHRADGCRRGRSVDRPGGGWHRRPTADRRNRRHPRTGPGDRGTGDGGGRQRLRHGPGDPDVGTVPIDYSGVVLRRDRGAPGPTIRRTGAGSTTPRSISCSSRRHRNSTR